MPPNKWAKGPNKQGRRCRLSYTPETKQYVINLHKDGKTNKEIITELKDKYGLKVSSSTVATFYKAENMERIEAHSVNAVAYAEAAVADAVGAVDDADAAVADAAAEAAAVSGAGTSSEGLTTSRPLQSPRRHLPSLKCNGSELQADLSNALSAVRDAMVWATQQLQSSSSVENSQQLIGLISESCKAITALQHVTTKEEIRN